jgi:hypothetical protein
MNCPQCGRALATGARQCVYCAHGTKVRPREQLAVPREAMAPRKSAFPWGKLIIVGVILAAVVVCLNPAVKPHLKPVIDRVKSLF